MNETVNQALALIVPLVIAIVFHEVAHGYVAKLLGDPTASEQGRLTLNPLPHVDPMGTIVVPGLLALFHLPVFGWAKPVPVIAERMRNPRLGMMLTAAAGPAMNLLMALVSALLIGLLTRLFAPDQQTAAAAFIWKNLSNFIQLNVFIALFNLLPIPPFDGSHILEGLLPRSVAQVYGRLRQAGMLLVIALIVILPQFVPGFNIVGLIIERPFVFLTDLYFQFADAIASI